MPNRVRYPKCRGQRTTCCTVFSGSGKRSIATITLGNCKVCEGTRQQRCGLSGGVGQVEPADLDLDYSNR